MSVASHTQPSHESALLRAVVLAELRTIGKPVDTKTIVEAVLEQVDSGRVAGLHYVERHLVRSSLVCLAAVDRVLEHKTGEVEISHGRRSRSEHSRAKRGTVKWSLPPREPTGDPGLLSPG
jgi:hypothetical protein